MASSFSWVSQIKCVVLVCLLFILEVGAETKAISNYTSLYPVVSYSSLSSAPQIQYDVFISFRGKDIREGFLSHLVEAFSRKQIVAFVDDKLERGDEISQALLGTIERSSIALIIFSQDYASSSWCLKELVKIVECRKKDGQLVMPVFYNVDPSDVRHQKGTYENAFAEHEKKYSNITVQIWRYALNESANLSGFHSSKFRNDAVLIEEIIKWATKRLKHMQQVNSKGLVGIRKSIAHLESLLCKGPNEVRVVGVWGMGGIGKTTLVGEVFNRLCSEYESCCFLANVREESKRQGIISLKNRLFSTLLNEKDLNIDTPNGLPYYIQKRLGWMKILIVLDDINDSEQLENLVGMHEWFGSGSRIIVTTRDRQVIAKQVNDLYKVEALNCEESLQLFNLNAFKQNHLEMEYYELSMRAVIYAKGIPLVLKVLGNLLHGKEKEIWESQLGKLQRMPSKKVQDVMRLSYDDLDREEQKMFLDVAWFFKGTNLKLDWLKILLKDHDNSVTAGLERLHDKALITISEDNIVSVHDIIHEMAKEIVFHEQCIEDPNKSVIRISDPECIDQVQNHNMEVEDLEDITSIKVHLSSIKELPLSSHIFANMSKLQFLDFYSISDQHYSLLPQGLQSLPNELRYLRWMHYPLKSLPTEFSAENLVILNLINSRLEKLWDGVKNLVNLKVVILSYSSNLKELPDFSKATNLEVLDLKFCTGLTHIHPSIFSLDNLKILDLSNSSITSLPSNIHLGSLHSLNLFGCSRLKKFSVTSESLLRLTLAMTGINEFPSSIIGRLSKLEMLDLAWSDIQSLPTNMKHLTRLKALRVSYLKLHTLPELPPSIQVLVAFNCTSLKTVLFPSTVVEQLKEKKRKILFWNCFKLSKHSRRAIGLNAQINLIKFSYQWLSALEHNKDCSEKATYVYPGSKVPEWFMYRTTHNYITIDLSFAPHSTQFGFIFCFIVPKVLSEGLSLKFRINDGEGKGGKDGINMDIDRPTEEIASDHVCLIYDQQWFHHLNSRAKNQPKFKIKVMAVSIMTNSKEVPVQIKGLGVSPMSDSEYHKFIQQLELGDSAISFDKWNWDIELMGHIICTIFTCLCVSLHLIKKFVLHYN